MSKELERKKSEVGEQVGEKIAALLTIALVW